MNRKIFATTATALTLTAGLLVSGTALAELDFSKYSNQEMMEIRNSFQNMSEADRAQFQAEMQKRMRNMTIEERQQMMGLNGQASKLRERTNADNDQGKGDMSRDRKRLEDGTGIGQAEQDKLRERINENSDQGKGAMERERMRNEMEGYGRGFGTRRSGGMGGGGRGR